MKTKRAKKISKKTIISIPGLGGHPTVFKGYEKILFAYDFYHATVIDWRKAQEEIELIALERGPVILLCNCYGAQSALRLIERFPDAVESLVIIEPYFSEFSWWSPVAFIANKIIIAFMQITDFFKIRRTKFKVNIDYSYLPKYPLFLQPLFDIQYQNMTDYFTKIDDILNFRLPKQIDTKTFLIFSPKGFIRGSLREKLFDIFKNSEIKEVGKNTHNIVAVSREDVAIAINDWLSPVIS